MPVNSFEEYPMSWVPVRRSDHMPLYRSFAQQLEEAVISGKLPPNTLLPPQRELADYLDVNLSTITKVYKICLEKGYLYAVVGKGTFVSPNAILYRDQVKSHAGNKVSKDTNLKKIEPFHQTDPYISKALTDMIARPDFYEMLSYQDEKRNAYNRVAGERYLEELKIPVKDHHVMLAGGSQNALTIVLLSLFSSGDKIAVDEFTYHHFKMLAHFLKIRLIPIRGDDAGMIPEVLQKKCEITHIQGIYLMPSCQNPTAIEMPHQRRSELADIIEKQKLILIEDDSYRFLTDLSVPSMFELIPDQTVYINSTSKSLCSGVRLAYMACASKYKERLQQAAVSVNLHVSFIDAELISELIYSGKAKKIQEQKKQLALKRNMLYDRIFDHEDHTNQYALFRWLKLNCQSTNSNIINVLDQSKIHVMESEVFNAGTKISDRYIRIALSTESDDNKLEAALRQIKFMITDQS